MIIEIGSHRRIMGTESAWELQRLRGYKGGTKWEPYKWFQTFRQALAEAVHHEIRTHPAIGLSEAIDAVAAITRRYEQLIPSEYRLSK
jgi:hypothetical protein